MKIFEKHLLGQDVKVKKLTVGDMFKIQSLEGSDEATQFFTIISLAMVEPKMTVEDVYNIDAEHMDDLTRIVELATAKE